MRAAGMARPSGLARVSIVGRAERERRLGDAGRRSHSRSQSRRPAARSGRDTTPAGSRAQIWLLAVIGALQRP